jgi:hypothetical protein
MAGTFGGDKDDVDILWGLHGFVVNGEAVAEEKALALAEIWSDIFFVHRGDFEVGNSDENDVGSTNGFGCGKNFESMLLGDGDRFAPAIQADGDFDSAVFQVQGMGVALGAKADDRNTAAFEWGEACVTVGVDAGGHSCFSG